ncbi:MAG: GNAT family N-acetyltransferase [Flavobacteriia bacterium]|nr:GNAT family N-acetyltransferase [Flavobacteriia bacterium]OIP45562.1 MAG: GNAT family N-acetyltransferase [Flavobacteriaceae bacterium CG2_30_31_66]PIV96816.1 MAG: GNAT family N-acetyltransferase [Flavobacteriaceae bacterium CG17_big_fil_post_rev_8_21_14_2_50_31_13]PIX12692.1 MAG: GNAT family N-acetyltransferase [Flavobacteriaceae bacterium CG_4_8_14_3_um_filter_31_8]PIY15039.1 MAG: GNAT family N-acetyltransferase [Flavobacteriaceae bacterium CG_4_10_14_3_um_filter_31_253]PIZ11452.1 MAG: GN
MRFQIKQFSKLSLSELYQILQLRSEVFVVEQDCVYQDIDFKDQKALHILGFKNDRIIAYTRIFKPDDYFENASIGRVVVKENERKFGYGHELMKVSIEAIKSKYHQDKITISAQLYLKKFYESHGFTQIGEIYLEDGIPHIRMDKN